jgi:hypothetical protein
LSALRHVSVHAGGCCAKTSGPPKRRHTKVNPKLKIKCFPPLLFIVSVPFKFLALLSAMIQLRFMKSAIFCDEGGIKLNEFAKGCVTGNVYDREVAAFSYLRSLKLKA